MSDEKWEDNSIQFPRLLAEIIATQDNLDMNALAESMDLEVEDVAELFERAQAIWDSVCMKDPHYILIAEGGGWPTHAIGPFEDYDLAERYMLADKWRESWGSVTDDPRDLPVCRPEDGIS